MVRRVPVILICLLLAMSAVHASGAEKTLTALISGNQQYLENTREVFDEFERRNPGIRIQIDPVDDVGPAFIVRMAAGTPPDIVRLRGTEPAEFGVQGMIMDLTELIRRDMAEEFRNFFPSVVPSLGWAGRTYSIPFGVTVQAILYNQTRFAEHGLPVPGAHWSWERDVIEAGKKISRDLDGDGKIDIYFLSPLGTLEWFPWVTAGGGRMFSEDGLSFLANSPAGYDALQFQGDLINVHKVMPSIAERTNDAFVFEKGTSVYSVQGSWFIGTMRRIAVPWEWDAAEVPTFKGVQATNIWPETPWSIPSTAPEPALSWRVLRFIGGREGQLTVAKLGLAMPILQSVARSPQYMRQSPPQNMAAFVEMAVKPGTMPIPAIPGWSNASRAMRPAYDSVMAGSKSASAALSEVAAAVEAQLRQAHEKMKK